MIFKNATKQFHQLCKISTISHHVHRNISALYLTGDKAKENYAVLTPSMDFEETFKDNRLENNLKLRRIDKDFKEIRGKYEVFKKKREEILNLEIRRKDIAQKLKEVKIEDENERNTLKDEGKRLREHLKTLKNKFYSVEDDFITKFLQLPNCLHEKTPKEHATLLYRKGIPEINKIPENCINHLERKDLIEFTDGTNYYLLNDAAIFDWEFPYNCVKLFLKENFTQTVNPDFGRSVLVEGALIDKLTLEEVIEETDQQDRINALHLTGGGCLVGFLGYITKLSVFPTLLPLKFISVGKRYSNITNHTLNGLYSTMQSNIIQTFIATETSNQADDELENVLNLVVDIYKKLDLHFRIQFLPADQLPLADSLRASIQVFSPVQDCYIEVGHISHYKDFISKRLLFNIRKQKSYDFPHIVSGTIADVTKIIACIIENGKELKAPSYFKNNVNDFIDFVS